jgi:hypothetical protein
LASTIRLMMWKVLRARRSIRVTVTPSPAGDGVKHAEKLAPVGPRAGHLLAINVAASRAA